MTLKQFLVILLLLGLFFVLYYVRKNKDVINLTRQTPAPTSQHKTTITIGNHEIGIDLADTNEKRARGLGGIRNLMPNQGMLFIFNEKDVTPPFWMKNMLIPIDIIWIDDGVVTQINARVEPIALQTADENIPLIIPAEPIDYVLEVRAGYTEQNQITVGDKVIIPDSIK